ncbi:MAG: NADH-quinone oxidoreductase subunit H [Proteobacteria bacterium]|nr:MAG: NADH-quinone oxidoreductase subunit H [Pseudomonadota bacterium]
MSAFGVGVVITNIIIALLMSLGGAPILVWMERRIAGLIQDRMGPNRCHIAGFRLGGIVQSFADMLKLVFKEDYMSTHIKRRFLFELAPVIVFVCSFLAFMVMPLADTLIIDNIPFMMQALPVNFGMLWFLALAGLSVYGIILGGWASDNKYSLLGSLRASAQMISYEASMVLSLISILLVYNSINLTNIAHFQGQLIFGFIPAWGIFLQPISAIIFIITSYAETNRAPFDMAEGESEIVGFHVEYSAMKFGLFFVGEYVAMCASSALIVTLFFGGFQIPWLGTEALKENLFSVLIFCAIVLPVLSFIFISWLQKSNKWLGDDLRAKETKRLSVFFGILTALLVLAILVLVCFGLSQNGINIVVALLQVICFGIKVYIMNFIFILVRWTLPRFRYDQLQNLGWKVLLPISLANVFVTALVVVGLQ